MTTNEAIKTILNHHAVEEVTLATKGKPSTYWIELKEGHKFGDGTHNRLVSEGKLKKIATLISI